MTRWPPSPAAPSTNRMPRPTRAWPETAWLKKYYPVEFMAALMNSVSTNTDKVAFYIQSCGRMGIRILPPDINRSNAKFSVRRLHPLRSAGGEGVGGGAIAFIEANRREKGPFRDLFDYAARVPGEAVNKKAVESLIRAGDGFAARFPRAETCRLRPGHGRGQ